MKKLVIIYWTAGTGGDMISSLLLSNSSLVAGTIPVSINQAGRVEVTTNRSVEDIFPPLENEHWYNRSWRQDVEKIENLDFDFLLQTVNESEFRFLKNYFGNSCITISVNYYTNIWQCVLKNFCIKILDSPEYLTKTVTGRKFLRAVSKTIDDEKYFKDLADRGKLGLWYCEQYLKGNLNFPPKSCKVSADFMFSLDEILNQNIFLSKIQDLNQILNFDLQCSLEFYKKWLLFQDSLYTGSCYYNFTDILGYNNTFPIINQEPKLTKAYDRLLYEYLNRT